MGYVFFDSKEAAERATELDGQLFKGRQLRVEMAFKGFHQTGQQNGSKRQKTQKTEKTEETKDQKGKHTTIFVGAITDDATDEDVTEFFTNKAGPVKRFRRMYGKDGVFVG